MATQTPNLNLDLREASDIFNPLSTNSNFETLDTVISDIQKKGGIVTYTTTASANLLKLSGNPTPNDTVFKFVAAGDANTWSYQEAVNNIVALDGKQKTVKAGELYVAWVNAANAMVVVAWPDVVNAQTFDGKGPAEWATKAQLDAVNQTAANATTTAQAAATVANNALEKAEAAGMKMDQVWTIDGSGIALGNMEAGTYNFTANISDYKMLIFVFVANIGQYATNLCCISTKNAAGNWSKFNAFTGSYDKSEVVQRWSWYGREVEQITNESFTVLDGKWYTGQGLGSWQTNNEYMNVLRVFGIK